MLRLTPGGQLVIKICSIILTLNAELLQNHFINNIKNVCRVG